MRVRLISAELVAAGALLAALVLVSPSELSKAYALITIVTGVLPGLMLTGDIKLLNAGVTTGAPNLRFKAITSATINIPIGAAGLLMQEHSHPLPLLLAFVVLGTLGATAQAFSSVWYYMQGDKRRMLRSKAASAAVKLTFAGAAIGFSEFTLALVGMTLGSMLEFALNFRSLPWHLGPAAGQRREIVSPLGAAYGVSRVVSAAVRLGLGQLFGPLIASFLVIEQLVGGLNSMFEKYFVRDSRWGKRVRALKLAYLAVMAAAVPLLASTTLHPGDKSALLWLVLVACAGLLPLAEMYAALQSRGQSAVAWGSSLISLACGVFLAIAWHQGALQWGSLAAYVLLPGCTFLLYWYLGLHATHHTEH